MSAADDLDTLYGVPPEEFTALRKDLATAAKKRGDPEVAKLIAASRRPTMAAWVVNLLVRADATARPRLLELTDALRAAHATMDGSRIRELTAAQRKLVNELTRAAFKAAGIADPSGALRDDVTGTLQAAIADPDVASRLGRLEKAEQWSGFGDFGLSGEGVTPTRRTPAPKQPAAQAPSGPDLKAMRRRRAEAAAKVDVAQAAHSEAIDAVADRKSKVATARHRYEKLLETLSAAERAVEEADAELDAAQRELHDTANRLETVRAELVAADSELGALGDE